MDIVPVKSNTLARLNSRLGKLAQQMITPNSGPSFARISTNKSRFSVVRSGEEPVVIKDGKNPVAELPVIVLAANPGVYKSYYKAKYVPGVDPEAPACFSSDGVKPSNSSAEKQSNSCATCKHNVFGSRISETGKKAKNCSDSKRILVVSPSDVSGEVYLMNISATALKGWNTYVKMLARNSAYTQTVVTNLSCTDAEFPQLQFDYASTLEEAVINVVLARLDEPEISEFSEGGADTESDFARKADPEDKAEAAHVSAAPAGRVEAAPEKEKGFNVGRTVEAVPESVMNLLDF